MAHLGQHQQARTRDCPSCGDPAAGFDERVLQPVDQLEQAQSRLGHLAEAPAAIRAGADRILSPSIVLVLTKLAV